jgi:DNA polymerase
VPPPLAVAPVAGPTGGGAPGDSFASLEEIARAVSGCTRCRLHEQRTKAVPGEGSPGAALVFVGEGPGEDEDRLGRPFVGRAGQLLDRMIVAMGLQRAEVFIANVVKCRPPGNRDPLPDEIAACRPYLHAQLDLIRPQVICALGKFSAQTLLETKEPISKLRGQFREYRGTPLMPTFHPSYLLRGPERSPDKELVWKDLQQVLLRLGLPVPPPRARRSAP